VIETEYTEKGTEIVVELHDVDYHRYNKFVVES